MVLLLRNTDRHFYTSLHDIVERAGLKSTPLFETSTSNRIYTGLGEDELYVVVPGADLPAITEALDVIASANAQIHAYAAGRRSQLSTE